MTFPIEDYGLIGDGRTAALVCRNGSIDWLCWPRFDSDACFASLLGTRENGRWLIAPVHSTLSTARRYREGTLVLETDFECPSGAVRIIDFMPYGSSASSIVRIVVGLHGTVTLRLDLTFRFDYGRLKPWVEAYERGFVAKAGSHAVRLETSIAVNADNAGAATEFTVTAEQRVSFVLQYFPSAEAAPLRLNAETLLSGAGAQSREWIGQFTQSSPWRGAIERSLLTLRALIYQPTGGLVAAPTTSLPEKPGGSLNWDYRYCWLRDATFTLTALLNSGYLREATAWRDWILRALAAEPAKLKIMYRIDGSPAVTERTLDWLPGYRWATPVRVGNAAADQLQVDVYGELLDAMELITRAGVAQSAHGRHVERELVRHLVEVWNEPGQGVWESRSEPRHYTYSRAMAWVGVDRFLGSATRLGHEDPHWLGELERLRAEIHAEVCSEGYHAGLGTFVRDYGGQELDASLLLMPIIGFLPADDPRIARTIAAVERELMVDGFVMRRRSGSLKKEGAFLACTCWLADCQRMQGRTAEAIATLERVLSVRNDLGLLSEEYNTTGRHLSGNFPQALTHLAVINTALGLSGPVLQRGGG